MASNLMLRAQIQSINCNASMRNLVLKTKRNLDHTDQVLKVAKSFTKTKTMEMTVVIMKMKLSICCLKWMIWVKMNLRIAVSLMNKH